MAIPFDPDFDAPKQGVDSRLAFAVGMVLAVLTLGTIGFLVLFIQRS